MLYLHTIHAKEVEARLGDLHREVVSERGKARDRLPLPRITVPIQRASVTQFREDIAPDPQPTTPRTMVTAANKLTPALPWASEPKNPNPLQFLGTVKEGAPIRWKKVKLFQFVCPHHYPGVPLLFLRFPSDHTPPKQTRIYRKNPVGGIGRTPYLRGPVPSSWVSHGRRYDDAPCASFREYCCLGHYHA